MTTVLLIAIIFVFLFIIVGITFWKPIIHLIREHRDAKLRMWCIEQASVTHVCNYVDSDYGNTYSTEKGFVSLAEKYYLFITEHITYLSDEDKKSIFPPSL